MKKNILIGTLILLNLGLIYIVKQKNKINRIQQTGQAQTIQQNTIENQTNSFIANKYWWELHSQGAQIPNVKLLSDISTNQDTLTLDEIIGDRPKLVMRYTELHCDVCVDATMKKLEQFTQQIGEENVLLISSYANPRDMYTFKRLNQIKLPLYNLGTQHLGLRAEEAETPYLFIIEPNRKAKMVFLSYKEVPDLISKYFEILKQKYFQD